MSSCRISPSDDDTDAVRERRCVLEVVRHEDRGKPEPVEQLAELRTDPGARVCVERRERLVEQEQRGVSRERARERDSLALAARKLVHPSAGELGDPEALEQRSDVPCAPRAETDVAPNVEMREERVLLEEVADASVFRRDVDPAVRVEKDELVERDDAFGGRSSPATTRSTVVFPAPDGPTSATVSPRSTVRSADARKLRRG